MKPSSTSTEKSKLPRGTVSPPEILRQHLDRHAELQNLDGRLAEVYTATRRTVGVCHTTGAPAVIPPGTEGYLFRTSTTVTFVALAVEDGRVVLVSASKPA